MSAENLGRQLNNLVGQDDGALITVDGYSHLAHGVTVPADASAGYAVGCIFQHTDGGDGTALYVNEGTITSSDFNAITVAA